jgi:PhnB protein
MRFITIFRSKGGAPSGPPSAEHIAAMRAEIGKAAESGVMVTTGGIGLRAQTGGRVTRDGDSFTVEAPPAGDGGWMAAGGFSIVNAESREALIEQLKHQLTFMGEGTVEFCEYKQFFPAAEAKLSPPQAAGAMPPGVVPYLAFDNATEVIEFYKRAFGATEVTRMHAADGKRIMHCQLEVNGGGLMVADTFPEYGLPPVQRSASYTMQLLVADGQAWWDRAVAAGCTVHMPFELAPWGDRYGQVKDPYGVTWAMNTPAVK